MLAEARRRAAVLFAFVGAMWIVRILDSLRGDGTSVAGTGIVPRHVSSLGDIVVAPFIHANWAHLLANIGPLLVLGALVLLGGTGEFVFVTLTSAMFAGAGSWLFGEAGRHIGASGVIFGYIGYLLFRPAYDRRLLVIVVMVAAIALYGSALLWSVVPRAGISWTAHAFGFVGGAVAARPGRRRR